VSRDIFYRVENINNKSDLFEFEKESDARSFILEKDLNENTHRLLKFEKIKDDLVRLNIVLNSGGKPSFISVSDEKDPSWINVIAAHIDKDNEYWRIRK